MIKTILFDIGGVIVTDGFRKTAEWLSLKTNIDKDTIFRAYIDTDDSRYSSGIITRERWDNFLDKTQINIGYDELIGYWHNTFLPIEETISIVRRLSDNYMVGCLSDQPIDIIPYLEGLGIMKLFSIRIISSELGCSKHDGTMRIYELALSASKVDKNEILFIDNSEYNILKAQEFGFNTILYKNPLQLREELVSKGLL